MELPLLNQIPYLNFLLFLPGVLAGAWMFLEHPRRIRAIPMFVIIAVMVVGLAWTMPTERGRGLVELALFAVPLPLSVLIARRKEWLRAVIVYLGASSVAAVYLLYDWLQSPARDSLGSYRYGSLYDENLTRIMEPNITATHLAFGVILVAILWLGPRHHLSGRQWQVISIGCLPVLFAGMVMSGSRGGTLSFLGAVTVLAALTSYRRRLSLRTNVLGGMALVALAALLLVVPNPVSQRIDSQAGTSVAGRTADGGSSRANGRGSTVRSFDAGQNTRSFGGRIEIWQAAVDASLSSGAMLLVGAGTGGADHAVAAADPDLVIAEVGEHDVLRANAHNSYLYWLVSYGLIGVLIAGAAFAVIAAYAFRIDWVQQLGAGSAMLAFFMLTSVTLIAFRLEMTSVAVATLTLGYILPAPAQCDLDA